MVMCECPATFEMHPHRPNYKCPPQPVSQPRQRRCDHRDCRRTDVQPGQYHPEGSCRSVPAAYCPRHKPSLQNFTPTPPDAASLRAANDEMLTTGKGERKACFCGETGGMHMWQPPLCPTPAVIPPSAEEFIDVVMVCGPRREPEVTAQVQCYCTGRGKPAGGHLWRMDEGCPRQPTTDHAEHQRAKRETFSDDALLADLFRRVLGGKLIALDMRPNSIGELHLRSNAVGNTVDLTQPEVDAIKRRFRT